MFSELVTAELVIEFLKVLCLFDEDTNFYLNWIDLLDFGGSLYI